MVTTKAYEATGLCEWVAGRKVRAGEILVLTQDEAEYELARGLIREAGARPWDRDDIDRRIIANVAEGRGEIIDSEEEVGGYAAPVETRAAFIPADWDLDTMEPLRPLPRREPLK